MFLDPGDPSVRAEAARQGIPDDWLEAARRSPVYALAARHKVALPLHPEYRTLPMVWYIPPLSPVADIAVERGADLFGAIEELRIPMGYLANLFTAGDPAPVRRALRALAAIRTHMRSVQLEEEVAADADLEDLYRLLAIAKYDDRYVIPPAHAEDAGALMAQHEQLFCSQPGGDGTGSGAHGHGHPSRDAGGRLHLNLSPKGPS